MNKVLTCSYSRYSNDCIVLHFRTTHRVLRLEKSESQPLGFDVCGGNKVGIFVKDIKDGSMAALGGMRVGDRILYVSCFYFHPFK